MKSEHLVVECKKCGHKNVFAQPYLAHAGFSDQNFLYSDSGHLTFVWGYYDPAWQRFLEDNESLDREELQERFENVLKPAPDGGRWRFSNPARCLNCSKPISDPPTNTVVYLLYPGSIVTDEKGYELIAYLR